MIKDLSSSILSVGCEYKNPKGGVAQVMKNYEEYVFSEFKCVVNSGGNSKLEKLLKAASGWLTMLTKLTFDKKIKIVHIHTASYNSFRRSAMTIDELKEVAKHPLVSIQSHTVNHPILTKLPEDLLDFELKESKKQLEAITDKEVFAFSYPNGSLTNREINATKKYYKIAFSTEQNNIRISDNIYTLPRYALTGDYNRDLLKLYGLWKYIRKIKDLLKK